MTLLLCSISREKMDVREILEQLKYLELCAPAGFPFDRLREISHFLADDRIGLADRCLNRLISELTANEDEDSTHP